jgi:hypothetical protein
MGCELGQGQLLSPAVDPVRARRLAGLGYWTIARTAEQNSLNRTV